MTSFLSVELICHKFYPSTRHKHRRIKTLKLVPNYGIGFEASTCSDLLPQVIAMQPYVLKQRKSYLEQYRSKQTMAQLNESNTSRKVLLPQIQKLKLLNPKCNKTPLKQRHRSTLQYARKVHFDNDTHNHPNFSESNGDRSGGRGSVDDSSSGFKKKVKSVQNSESFIEQSNSFTEMINTYTKSLDLTKYERQCLGFSVDEHELSEDETGEPVELIHSHNESPREMESTMLERHGKRTISSKEEKRDESPSSPWSKFIDVLNPTRWISTDANDEDKANEDYVAAPAAATTKTSEDIFEASSCDLLNSGILALLDQVCKGDHADGVRNCFKCQHKESFKAFTAHYLDELDNIWRNRDLFSREERDANIIQTLEVWIYNLTEQNLSLAEAYDESARASEKLKSILLQSRNSMRTHQKEMDKSKSQIDGLNYELSLRDQAIKKLKCKNELEVVQTKDLERKLQETKTDVESLTELIIRLRDKGVWDIHGLPLGDEAFKKIFNGDYYLHGAKVIGCKEFSSMKREWKNEIEALKTEGDTLRAIIASKDREIQRCKSGETTKLKRALIESLK